MTIPAEQHDLLTIRQHTTHVWIDHNALRLWMASCSLETFKFPYPGQCRAYPTENAPMVLLIHTEPGQSQDNGQRGSVQP